MPDSYTPQSGDLVRVTVEGTVTPSRGSITNAAGLRLALRHAVAIEKVTVPRVFQDRGLYLVPGTEHVVMYYTDGDQFWSVNNRTWHTRLSKDVDVNALMRLVPEDSAQ